MSDRNDREVIEAGRRRKGSGGKPQGRAEAPVRRAPGSGQGGGMPRPPGGGFRTPTRGQAGGCGTIVLIILAIGYFLFSGGGGLESSSPVEQPFEQPYQEQAQPPQTEFTPPVASPQAKTFTLWRR